MRIDVNKSRLAPEETPREKELRGRLDKAEQEIAELKKRVTPEPVKPDAKRNA